MSHYIKDNHGVWSVCTNCYECRQRKTYTKILRMLLSLIFGVGLFCIAWDTWILQPAHAATLYVCNQDGDGTIPFPGGTRAQVSMSVTTGIPRYLGTRIKCTTSACDTPNSDAEVYVGGIGGTLYEYDLITGQTFKQDTYNWLWFEMTNPENITVDTANLTTAVSCGTGTCTLMYSETDVCDGNRNGLAPDDLIYRIEDTDPLICGNGEITGSEYCDDGNTDNGDGCSSACAIEADYNCQGEPSTCWNQYLPAPGTPAPQEVRITPYIPTNGGWILASAINDPTPGWDSIGYFIATSNISATATSLSDSAGWQAEVALDTDRENPLCTDEGGLTNVNDRVKGLNWTPTIAAGCETFTEGTYYAWRTRARYGSTNEYGPWSPWARFLAAPDTIPGGNGQYFGNTIPRTMPDCDLWGGIWDAPDPKDGLACVWSWTKYVIEPTDQSWQGIIALRDLFTDTYPTAYVADIVSVLAPLYSTAASSCPSWLTLTGTDPFDDFSINFCTPLETLKDQLDVTYVQNFFIAAIGLITLAVIIRQIDSFTEPTA